MSDVNLHESIVRYLEGRGRWLKAGNDNIIGYLSIQINAGPGHLGDIRQVLLDAEAPLHVEHVEGRVGLVGLRSWLEEGRPSDDFSDQKSEELLSALEAGQMREAQLASELATLRAGRQDASSDELVGEALQAIGERDGLIGRIAELEAQLAAPVECQECASLARRLQNALDAASTIRDNFRDAQRTNAALDGRLVEAERATKKAGDALKVVRGANTNLRTDLKATRKALEFALEAYDHGLHLINLVNAHAAHACHEVRNGIDDYRRSMDGLQVRIEAQ